jgi:ABC-type bacteriocin/lantibiotic exporter with double-glycine peptidase domain
MGFDAGLLFIALFVTSADEPHTEPGDSTSLTHDRLCGRDSLYLLLKLQGHNPNFAAVTNAVPPRANMPGISMDELRRGAEQFGITLVGVKLREDDVRESRQPFIAYVTDSKRRRMESGHFFVVTCFGPDRVQILNPPRAPYVVPVRQLFESWEGYALVPVSGSSYRQWTLWMAAFAFVLVAGLMRFRARITRSIWRKT